MSRTQLNWWRYELTQNEEDDHEHSGEEQRLYVDLVEDLVEREQGGFSAVKHDAKATENHAEREEWDPAL